MIHKFWRVLPAYFAVFSVAILIMLCVDHSVPAFSNQPNDRSTIILDPGHGGEDGGAISYSGIKESQINLQISIRLNDLLHLLGYDTILLRSSDTDLHTEGSTISERKKSDLYQRVSQINQTPNGVLISIHQNQFSDRRYSGAQVFWANTTGSKALAEQIQGSFVSDLAPENNRAAKQAKGIYLTDHINCTGVLVECGFISNPAEEALLITDNYQIKLVCVLATSIATYLETANTSV